MKSVIAAILGILLFAGCALAQDITGRAKVTDAGILSELPKTKPAVIYVRDFDLEAEDIKQQQSPVKRGPQRTGIRDRLRGQSADSGQLSGKLVDSMADELVSSLMKQGVRARRISVYEPMPASGWLVRGIFTEVDEGNRLSRAVVGFGSGATKIDLNVNIADLSSNAVRPFYSIDTSKSSGKMPGAIITLNPYVAAAKFVLSKNSLDRDIKRTASKISDQLVEQIKQIEKNEAAKTVK